VGPLFVELPCLGAFSSFRRFHDLGSDFIDVQGIEILQKFQVFGAKTHKLVKSLILRIFLCFLFWRLWLAPSFRIIGLFLNSNYFGLNEIEIGLIYCLSWLNFRWRFILIDNSDLLGLDDVFSKDIVVGIVVLDAGKLWGRFQEAVFAGQALHWGTALLFMDCPATCTRYADALLDISIFFLEQSLH
jgi:hypothetical protein